LMQKLKDDTIVPWSWGSKFKDGSLRVDIPVQALNLYFNVTHPVVSQVNPHVHLFFFAPQGSAGKPVAHRKRKGWRGNFLLSAAEQWLKLELSKNFKLIRDLDLLPQLLGQDWSSVFLQRFEGAVTIWPKTRFKDWFRILSDPDPPELERMIRVGQLVTWPKLHMIENRYRLEKQIHLGRQAVRKVLQMKDKDLNAIKQTQSHVIPPQAAVARLPEQGEAIPTQPTDDPMSMDTDTEVAIANHSPIFFKQRSGSGSSTPREFSKETVQHFRPSIPRKRTSSLFRSHGENEEQIRSGRAMVPDPPQSETLASGSQSVPSSPSFFTRLRTRSNLSSPFATLRKRAGSQTSEKRFLEHSWSSDSSSDDDMSPDWRRQQQLPSLHNFPVDND